MVRLFYGTIVLSVCPVYANVGVLWPNGWMDQDATWYEGWPRPRRHCVRWGPGLPLQKGAHQPPPLFGPCLLWPKSDLLYSHYTGQPVLAGTIS